MEEAEDVKENTRWRTPSRRYSVRLQPRGSVLCVLYFLCFLRLRPLVPQRLKPLIFCGSCGTAEAVP